MLLNVGERVAALRPQNHRPVPAPHILHHTCGRPPSVAYPPGAARAGQSIGLVLPFPLRAVPVALAAGGGALPADFYTEPISVPAAFLGREVAMKPPPMLEPPIGPLPDVIYDASLLSNEKDHLKVFRDEIVFLARDSRFPGFSPDGLYRWMGSGPPEGRTITLEKIEASGEPLVVFGEEAATLLAFDLNSFRLYLHYRWNAPQPRQMPT